MKTIKISITIALICSSFIANSQIKVNSIGNVGIRESNPSHNVDVKCGTVNFQHPNPYRRPLKIVTLALDPRIYSEEQVVFIHNSGTHNIDIQCRQVYEYSDSTEKENIRSITDKSLEKILKMQGVNFNWKSDKLKKEHAGFLAQDVEKIIPEIVTTVDSSGKKLITHSGLLPYIAEAIKAQQLQIETLQAEIEKLKIKDPKTKSTADNNLTNSSQLFQNQPNPFSVNTYITYYLPDVINKATIYIYDLQGRQVRAIDINDRGQGSAMIHGSELNAGTYHYTLIADGQIVGTHTMILTN